MKHINIACLLFAVGFLLVGCDPGHHGIARIENHTSFELKLKYATHYEDTTIVIAPMQTREIIHFGGLGEGRQYPGAMIEFDELLLTTTDTSYFINKPVDHTENWEMKNENTRRYSSKLIECWYTISQENILHK